ncbi:hypothetical protein GCM10007859_13460 [Brevundimonas denitrificans]|uniref:Uncharacterized protein n=1 Tax=Brevundimonas denitrificans TaxID=1443434 RepID=A0ABQ6BH45_9CAUL|nr:hypothetical protein [Brevundimonas denitrificans]GLS01333.1 hypothetical protein GCM10007859_13460 [Brevundimonas denitrificans]
MVVPFILTLTLLFGQDGSQQPSATLPEVVVRAPPGDPVAVFVRGTTVPGEHGRYQGQVARWDADLCISVVGSAPEMNAWLTEQITANFRSLGVPHGASGCEPTVAVVISMNADAFAETFARSNRNRIFRTREGAVTQFLGPPRPVRWRHVTRTGPVGPDPEEEILAEGLPAELARMSNSRIRTSTARGIEQAIIVVDAQRASAAPLDALAAYIAFVALVDLPAEPSTAGQRTILSLFDGAAADRPRALTRWDRAFIGALYSVTPDDVFSLQQREIELRMRRKLEETTISPPDPGNTPPTAPSGSG